MMIQTLDIELGADISDLLEDGRLIAEPDGKKYRYRDAIALQRSLGRPLTDEEFESFRIA